MKQLILSLIVVILANICIAQEDSKEMISIEINFYSANFEKSKELANTFIEEKNAIISRTVDKESSYYANFFIDENSKEDFDKLIEELGYIYSKNISTMEYQSKIDEFELELKFLQTKKEEYEKELEKMAENEDKYYVYWEEVRRIDNQIFEKEKQLMGYSLRNDYQIIINIYDDNTDLTEKRVNWVNMPGASFDFLMIENPASAISGEYYMGYSLKYMITRGKSYFTLGNLKEFDASSSDSTRYTEFFNLGFGMDFYTKHFGRGKRQWFNLYTGYNAGGLFATNSLSGDFIPYTKVFLGVEIFKNKYFLIDNKIGYFVPFVENKNLRGLEYNFSLNFVF